MITDIARELAYWIDANAGKQPSAVRVPQAIADACIQEAKKLALITDKQYAVDGMKILGIPVLVDPTLTIGKINP